jgi:diaminopimelate epimerase
MTATVEMGVVRPGPVPEVVELMEAVGAPVASVRRWETGDIGNPHVVCEVDDPDEIDLALAGPAIEAHFEDGANVHFVTVSGTDEIYLRVWERGAGITNACGTGATVSANIFHRWGLVDRKVIVRMPGGDALVDVGDPTTLTGPATHVADLLVPDLGGPGA